MLLASLVSDIDKTQLAAASVQRGGTKDALGRSDGHREACVGDHIRNRTEQNPVRKLHYYKTVRLCSCASGGEPTTDNTLFLDQLQG